jgi:hypothetical protein
MYALQVLFSVAADSYRVCVPDLTIRLYSRIVYDSRRSPSTVRKS